MSVELLIINSKFKIQNSKLKTQNFLFPFDFLLLTFNPRLPGIVGSDRKVQKTPKCDSRP
jgi:hypothetical protein